MEYYLLQNNPDLPKTRIDELQTLDFKERIKRLEALSDTVNPFTRYQRECVGVLLRGNTEPNRDQPNLKNSS